MKDGRTISREEAVSSFRDSTGRPGPATWEGGTFPKGSERHPVAGVSWYEAAAYAGVRRTRASHGLPLASCGSTPGYAVGKSCPGATFSGAGHAPGRRPGRARAASARTTWRATSRSGAWAQRRLPASEGPFSAVASARPAYLFVPSGRSSPPGNREARPTAFAASVHRPRRRPNASAAKLECARSRDFSKRRRPVSDEALDAFSGRSTPTTGEARTRKSRRSSTIDETPDERHETITLQRRVRRRARLVARLSVLRHGVASISDRRLLSWLRYAMILERFMNRRSFRKFEVHRFRAEKRPGAHLP